MTRHDDDKKYIQPQLGLKKPELSGQKKKESSVVPLALGGAAVGSLFTGGTGAVVGAVIGMIVGALKDKDVG